MMTATQKPRVDAQLLADAEVMAAQAFRDHQVEVRLSNGVYRVFRCGRPGSSICAFWVATTPGMLFVYGDVGELVVSRTYDMLAWAKSAIRDPNYFAEKVPHCAIKTREWSYAKAIEWIDEEIADAQKERDSERDEDDDPDRMKCPKCGNLVLVLEDETFEPHKRHPGLGGIGSGCSNGGEPATRAARLKALREAAATDGLNGEMSEHEFNLALYESDLEDGCDWPDHKVFTSNFLWTREAVKWLLANLPPDAPEYVI